MGEHKCSISITKREMAHLLRRIGEAALKGRKTSDGKFLPPIISREDAMRLREQFYRDGQ
jgi:hypothetical protein